MHARAHTHIFIYTWIYQYKVILALQLLTKVTSCHGNSMQGVFDVDAVKGLILIELAEGVSLEDVSSHWVPV